MGMVARAAGKTTPTPMVNVPAQDEPIERWGSFIRWSAGLRHVKVERRTSSAYHRWEVTVECGACGAPRPAWVRDTAPASGVLSAACLSDPAYSYSTFGGFTGLCSKCLARLTRPDVEYFDGTKLLHRERTKDGLPVFCGQCKKVIFLKCALSETLHDRNYPCPSCGHTLGKWLHEQSGATVYWLKRKDGQRNYVEFECAKCGGEFYCKDELPVRAEWWGLCPEDRLKHNPQRVADKKTLPGSGKVIDYGKDRFGEGKPKGGKKSPRQGMYVRVPCPLPGCGRVNPFHFETTRKAGFTGLCKPGKNGHKRDEIALFFLNQSQNPDRLGASPQAQNDGREEMRGNKDSTRANAFDGAKFLSDVKKAIIGMHQRGVSRTDIKANAIAHEVGLRGSNGAEQLRQNLRKAGETRRIPQFVNAVIDEGKHTATAVPV